MTVEELLKSQGITEEVIKGLPKEVVGALSTYHTEAESKLTTAQQKESEAAELRRQAELEKEEVKTYVEQYGTDLTKMGSKDAKLAAYDAYLQKLKEQGFEVPADLLSKEIPVTKPNTSTSNFDPDKFRGEVGSVMSQFLDANNEYFRLYGSPLPESSTSLAEEAARARKPIRQYIAERYKFEEKKQEKIAADAKAREDQIRKDERALVEREFSERSGQNPNLRPGETSRNSFVPKIKSEDFHTADGNVPQRTRHNRLLDKIHAEVRELQSA